MYQILTLKVVVPDVHQIINVNCCAAIRNMAVLVNTRVHRAVFVLMAY